MIKMYQGGASPSEVAKAHGVSRQTLYRKLKEAGIPLRGHNRRLTESARIRAKLGLTQAEFATEMGVSESLVAKWERGKGEPTLTAKKYMKVLVDKQVRRC